VLIVYFYPVGGKEKEKKGGEVSDVDSLVDALEREWKAPEIVGGPSRPVLAYVTPWNSLGYDLAKSHRNAFTHVSPVWFQLRGSSASSPSPSPSSYAVTGKHDVDFGWMEEVRFGKGGDGGEGGRRRVKIVPRVILDQLSQADVMRLVVNNPEGEGEAVGILLASLCEEFGLDGVVLELWSLLPVRNLEVLREGLRKLIRSVGSILKKTGSVSTPLELILVVPPDLKSFGTEDLKALAGAVSMVSVNTYDFSSPSHPGPLAPLPWVESTLAPLAAVAAQTSGAPTPLLGLNFYGLRAAGGRGEHVLGRQFIDQVRSFRDAASVQWLEREGEHVVAFRELRGAEQGEPGEETRLFYPSARSVAVRSRLASRLGVGLCIWELGQGTEGLLASISEAA